MTKTASELSSQVAQASRLTVLHNDWWAGLYEAVAARTHDWLEGRYQRASSMHVGPFHGGKLLQGVVLNVLLGLPYFVFGRYRALIFQALALIFPGLQEYGHASEDAYGLPRFYPVMHAGFLLACVLPVRWHARLLPPCLLVVAVLFGLTDLGNMLAVAVLTGLVFLLGRAPWLSRAWKVVAVCLVYVGVLCASQYAERGPAWLFWPLGRRTGVSWYFLDATEFIPLLWYATYEIHAGRLSVARYAAYIICVRTFDGPVLRPGDLAADDAQRLVWQWRGIRTLANALIARALMLYVSGYLDSRAIEFRDAHGLALVWYSFCHYLLFSLVLVSQFNLFVGWARLFGLPIRDVFYFWLLARTPNERWRRWNTLFREWILAYVFYPMMRAGKGVFLAVMATLLGSGLLHVVYLLTPPWFDPASILRILAYWAFNGLAIYAVIAIPRRFPAVIERLHMRESVLWSLVGILSTITIYSIATALRDRCQNGAEALDFLQRLVTLQAN